MITCLGLPVGIVESAKKQDFLNQCASFLKLYPHLLDTGVEFKVDNKTFATILDDTISEKTHYVLFQWYDETWGIGSYEV